MNPDASAARIHEASKRGSGAWVMWLLLVSLACWLMPTMVLLGLFVTSTNRDGPVQLSLRLLSRILAAVAFLALVAFGAGLPGAGAVGGVALLMLWPVYWGHLLTLTRAGSRLREEVLGVGTLITAGMVLSALLLNLGGRAMAINGAIAILGTQAVMVASLSWLMGRYWRAPAASPEAVQTAIHRSCRALGFEEAPWVEGMWLLGHRKGRRADVKLHIRQAPCQITLETLLPEWPDGARARVRMEGEQGGLPLSDPLLSRLLYVEGLPEADRILADLHEPLLAILHAWPGSQIHDRRIQVILRGPPFALGTQSEELQSPRWIGVFVMEQLTAAVDLADLLAPRLLEAFPPPESTEEVLAPFRQRRPERE